MIITNYATGLGNHLFQYCFARMLAHELGYKLNVSPIRGFSGTSEVVDGLVFDDSVLKLDGQVVDFVDLINNPPSKNILCAGLFQRIEYYEKYKDEIKNKWLVPDKGFAHDSYDVLDDDIVVHVRRGDYVNNSDCMSFDQYQNIIENYVKTWNRMYICTDCSEDPFIDNFNIYVPIIYSDNGKTVLSRTNLNQGTAGNTTDEALNDFCFLGSFNRIVLSASTFSWWAAFLSNASEIYYPRFANFVPNAPNGHDLLPKETRYIVCEV